MKLYSSLLAMLVLVLSCSPRAHATDIVWTPYMSMDEAAHDALVDAYNCGEQRRECGGVIYRYENKSAVPYVLYFYTTPVTSNRKFGVTISALAEPAPRHMTTVGDFHNHVCSKYNRGFSGLFSFADLITNQGFHTVGYILDGCNGAIRRYDPSQDVADDVVIMFKSGRELDLTAGHVTGWLDIFRSVK